MADWIDVEQARRLPGLRLVLTQGVPGPWGEAAKGVSPETRARFPEVRWKAVAGMKDIATHQYHGIMLELVWETASVRVPELLRSLEQAG